MGGRSDKRRCKFQIKPNQIKVPEPTKQARGADDQALPPDKVSGRCSDPAPHLWQQSVTTCRITPGLACSGMKTCGGCEGGVKEV